MKTAVAIVLLAACAESPAVPTGEHFHYVVDKVNLATSSSQALGFSIDVDGDNDRDNNLGQLLAAVADLGIGLQPAIDDLLARGEILMLVDLQTIDFQQADAAAFQLQVGGDPVPSPCDGPADPICGRHLDGNATFRVAANSPSDAALVGSIDGNRLVAGPGVTTIQLALGAPERVDLELVGARVNVHAISDTNLTATIGGALTRQSIDERVMQAFHRGLSFAVERDCAPTTPPNCECVPGSGGSTVISHLDSSPADCQLSLAEVTNSTLVQALFAPDLRIDNQDVLSFGFEVTAVRATIAP